MGDEMESDLVNLLGPSVRADVRGRVFQELLGMTGGQEGCMYIAQRAKLLEAMMDLVLEENSTIKKDAVKCVINLSAEEPVVHRMLALESVLSKVVLHLLQQSLDPELASNAECCILTNITRVNEGARFVADVIQETESMGIAWYVDRLCQLHAKNSETLISVSTLLMNLTQVTSVRRGLMSPPAPLLKLLPIVSLTSTLSRHKGIVGAVQNCCFEYDFHDWLLSDEVGLLPRLLLPLTGPEEFDEDDMEKLPLELQYLPDTQEREADPQVRKMLIQAVHQLCSTKGGRQFIKEKNAYVIFRELHKWESSEENVEAILKVIDILIGDEPKEGMEDLHTVDVPPDMEKKFLQEDEAGL